MRKSRKLDILTEEMNTAVEELQNELKSLPGLLIPPPGLGAKTPRNDKGEQILTATPIPLVEVIPLATFVSLLTEIAARVEGIVDAVEELESLAEFKPAVDDKPKENQLNNITSPDQQKDEETMEVLQKV